MSVVSSKGVTTLKIFLVDFTCKGWVAFPVGLVVGKDKTRIGTFLQIPALPGILIRNFA